MNSFNQNTNQFYNSLPQSPARSKKLSSQYIYQNRNISYLELFFKHLFYYYNKNELILHTEKRRRKKKEYSKSFVFPSSLLEISVDKIKQQMKTGNFSPEIRKRINGLTNGYYQKIFIDDKNFTLDRSLNDSNIIMSRSNKPGTNFSNKVEEGTKFNLIKFLGSKDINDLNFIQNFIEGKINKNNSEGVIDKDDQKYNKFFVEIKKALENAIQNKQSIQEEECKYESDNTDSEENYDIVNNNLNAEELFVRQNAKKKNTISNIKRNLVINKLYDKIKVNLPNYKDTNNLVCMNGLTLHDNNEFDLDDSIKKNSFISQEDSNSIQEGTLSNRKKYSSFLTRGQSEELNNPLNYDENCFNINYTENPNLRGNITNSPTKCMIKGNQNPNIDKFKNLDQNYNSSTIEKKTSELKNTTKYELNQNLKLENLIENKTNKQKSKYNIENYQQESFEESNENNVENFKKKILKFDSHSETDSLDPNKEIVKYDLGEKQISNSGKHLIRENVEKNHRNFKPSNHKENDSFLQKKEVTIFKNKESSVDKNSPKILLKDGNSKNNNSKRKFEMRLTKNSEKTKKDNRLLDLGGNSEKVLSITEFEQNESDFDHDYIYNEKDIITNNISSNKCHNEPYDLSKPNKRRLILNKLILYPDNKNEINSVIGQNEIILTSPKFDNSGSNFNNSIMDIDTNKSKNSILKNNKKALSSNKFSEDISSGECNSNTLNKNRFLEIQKNNQKSTKNLNDTEENKKESNKVKHVNTTNKIEKVFIKNNLKKTLILNELESSEANNIESSEYNENHKKREIYSKTKILEFQNKTDSMKENNNTDSEYKLEDSKTKKINEITIFPSSKRDGNSTENNNNYYNEVDFDENMTLNPDINTENSIKIQDKHINQSNLSSYCKTHKQNSSKKIQISIKQLPISQISKNEKNSKIYSKQGTFSRFAAPVGNIKIESPTTANNILSMKQNLANNYNELAIIGNSIEKESIIGKEIINRKSLNKLYTETDPNILLVKQKKERNFKGIEIDDDSKLLLSPISSYYFTIDSTTASRSKQFNFQITNNQEFIRSDKNFFNTDIIKNINSNDILERNHNSFILNEIVKGPQIFSVSLAKNLLSNKNEEIIFQKKVSLSCYRKIKYNNCPSFSNRSKSIISKESMRINLIKMQEEEILKKRNEKAIIKNENKILKSNKNDKINNKSSSENFSLPYKKKIKKSEDSIIGYKHKYSMKKQDPSITNEKFIIDNKSYKTKCSAKKKDLNYSDEKIITTIEKKSEAENNNYKNKYSAQKENNYSRGQYKTIENCNYKYNNKYSIRKELNYSNEKNINFEDNHKWESTKKHSLYSIEDFKQFTQRYGDTNNSYKSNKNYSIYSTEDCKLFTQRCGDNKNSYKSNKNYSIYSTENNNTYRKSYVDTNKSSYNQLIEENKTNDKKYSYNKKNSIKYSKDEFKTIGKKYADINKKRVINNKTSIEADTYKNINVNKVTNNFQKFESKKRHSSVMPINEIFTVVERIRIHDIKTRSNSKFLTIV